MISPIEMTRAGSTTSSNAESSTSWRSAMITPPTPMIGAVTSIVKPMNANSCTCWTSLVLRVMRVGAPNCTISRAANVSTVVNTAARKSRPSAIAVRAPT